MANVMTLEDVQYGERSTIFIYKVVLSGSYVQVSRGTNTGELLNPNGASNPNNLTKPTATAFDRGYPIQGPAGNGAEILPGADSTHWLLKVFSAANTELAAGAYNAAVTGDLDFKIAMEAKNYR